MRAHDMRACACMRIHTCCIDVEGRCSCRYWHACMRETPGQIAIAPKSSNLHACMREACDRRRMSARLGCRVIDACADAKRLCLQWMKPCRPRQLVRVYVRDARSPGGHLVTGSWQSERMRVRERHARQAHRRRPRRTAVLSWKNGRPCLMRGHMQNVAIVAAL